MLMDTASVRTTLKELDVTGARRDSITTQYVKV